MAKNSSKVQAKRNDLIEEIEGVLRIKMKRSATATGGLACSNESQLANGFAHLLCNEKNFPTVWWALYNEVAIPLEFQDNFNRTSFLYACGTAPRIVLKGSKHVSKDAVKSGLGQEFVQWAQAQRIAGVGGLAGLSASIREGIRFGQMDDFGELVGRSSLEENQLKAANQQIAMRKVSESVGRSDFQKVVGTQKLSATERVDRLIAAMKAARSPVPKATPVTELAVEAATPVTELAVEAATPVTELAVEAAAPVTEPAVEAVEAATDTGGKKKRVGKKAAPVTEPAVEAATDTGGKKKRVGKKAAATITLID